MSEIIGRPFPHVRGHLYEAYPVEVCAFIDRNPSASILDVGAGKSCPYAAYFRTVGNGRIIGIDVSLDEISQNNDLDEAHISDVTASLPFGDNTFDAVVSRSVLEHLTDQDGFFREAKRVLKPGGVFIHMLPNRFAPFALVNQMLPNSISKRLLGFTWESSKGICGFPAHYDKCYPTGFEKLFTKHGFVKVSIRVSYYQSFYYAFFFPFYMLSMLYEVIVSSLKFRNLSAHLLIYAEQPSDKK
ncbi:MAG: class I SAM-dependent methyltransferase [bacterium]|nr:class I SAM-dependent methyltransferase [bacterium]